MDLTGVVKRLVPELLKAAGYAANGSPQQRRRERRAVERARTEERRALEDEFPSGRRAYPGDYTGVPEMVWSARPDGRPDPGEVVWTWVPFQEDHKRGKDRPVLLIGRDGPWLLALQLTSKDHDLDEAQEIAEGRFWVDIGAGDWDRRGRESEVGVHRIVRVDPRNIRREGAILDRARFDAVASALREHRGT